MKKTPYQSKIIACCILFFACATRLFSQSNISQKQIEDYYQQALDYKEGRNHVKQDFAIAVEYFSLAAKLGDPQSEYALGYMLYKGLGCQQNYDSAAKLFWHGATLGRDNSLYFYGLCWRNGYGLPKNGDSAKFYLQKAADLGYRQAILELQLTSPENSHDTAARLLLAQIHNSAIPLDTGAINQYRRITPHLPASQIIEGNYKGYLIEYDWSGQHIIYTKPLKLKLQNKNGKLEGTWIELENDSADAKADTAKIKAEVESDSLKFSSSEYKHTDHYSPSTAMSYKFQNAKLNLVEAGDSIFLAGNIEQYSAQRGEPAKPIIIALSRPGLRKIMEEDDFSLIAFPNPFQSALNVQFTLDKQEMVDMQFYAIDGLKVYDNPSGTLAAGTYVLTIQTQQFASGAYILKFTHGNNFKTIKVVKE